jgi:hypothetical protein
MRLCVKMLELTELKGILQFMVNTHINVSYIVGKEESLSSNVSDM